MLREELGSQHAIPPKIEAFYTQLSSMSIKISILSRDEVIIDGVWIGNGFIEHLQIVTTINCRAIVNSCTLQFTTARTISSKSAASSPTAW
jgi:hypothetical protein